MKDLQLPYNEHSVASETQYASDDYWRMPELQASQETIDSEFLDAVCNGIITVGDNLKIVSQNYVSRANMGDLRGQTCYKVLENRDTPCENCPKAGRPEGFETSMRCAGKDCTLYETRLYGSENGTVIEVYPNMIDREVLLTNMHLYDEEMQLLREVIEDISTAIADDQQPGEAEN